MKIIELKTEKEEKEKRRKTKLLKVVDKLRDAIEEDRLHQFIVQWEETLEAENNSVAEEYIPIDTTIAHYHKDGDLDKTLGFATKLTNRLFLLSEGLGEEE